jgi:hypothetical protein
MPLPAFTFLLFVALMHFLFGCNALAAGPRVTVNGAGQIVATARGKSEKTLTATFHFGVTVALTCIAVSY